MTETASVAGDERPRLGPGKHYVEGVQEPLQVDVELGTQRLVGQQLDTGLHRLVARAGLHAALHEELANPLVA